MTPTTVPQQVCDQVTDELDRALASPAGSLLGLDIADQIRRRVKDRAWQVAWQVRQNEDDALAAETVIDLMSALWPNCAPEECGEAAWWRTPLGRVCARSLGRDDSDSVTRSVAAAMLGVHPGTVAQMTHRGTLDRHPDGGVTRASVLLRLAR